MNVLDIIIIITLAAGAFTGYRRGIIIQVCAIAGILLGVFLAYKIAGVLNDWLNVGEEFAPVLNFIIVLLVVVIVFMILGRIMRAVVRKTLLSVVERVGGLLLSLALFGLLSGMLWGFVDKINSEYKLFDEKFFSASALYEPLTEITDLVFPYLVDKGELLWDEARNGNPLNLHPDGDEESPNGGN